MENNYVTQTECEQRRNNIKKDFTELSERVRQIEIAETKTYEQIKTLFTIVKFITGISSTVLAAEIINFIGRVV